MITYIFERVLKLTLSYTTMSSTSRTKRLSGLPTYTVSVARLRSFYSDFSRQKTSNPASYNSNIEWWKKTLSQYVGRGLQDDISSDTLILHASPELLENLRYEGVGKPLGLAAVIVRLNGIPLQAFAHMPDLGRTSCVTLMLSYITTNFSNQRPLYTIRGLLPGV